MKKVFLFIFVVVALSSGLRAQQDAQYTNFMFNKLVLNPGYAGSYEVASITALYRNQWLGLDGAPKTASLSFHTPAFDGKMGLGVYLEGDYIGFTRSYKTNLSYAYRIPMGKGKLAIGVQGGIRAYRVDWTKAQPHIATDPAKGEGVRQTYLPNFGTGVFYYAPKWYAGISMPHLINGNIDAQNGTGSLPNDVVARERRHAFLMGGFVLPISSKVKFTPNVLFKYVKNTPFDFDLNASFLFFDKLTVGATYRLGDSVDGLLHYYITPQLRLGVGYDYTLSELQKYNDASFEVLLGYDFVSKSKKVLNPRFFW